MPNKAKKWSYFMCKYFIILFLSFFGLIAGTAQTVPKSFEAAKRIGDTKFKVLQKANEPEPVRCIVLKKGGKLGHLLKYENAVYYIDKDFDLKGQILGVPKNSVIVFREGIIKNGTLQSEDAKYSIIGNKVMACRLEGKWKKIAPLIVASGLGLIAGNKSASNDNYARVNEIVKKGWNVYLDGTYYVSFPKPIMLNYELHIFGGKLFFNKHAFDVTDGGGLYANGVHFISIPESKTDDIVCGTREKHPAIITAPLTFLNCHFSCNRVVSLDFQHANPVKKSFGIKAIHVEKCFSDHTGKFIVLDAPFLDECVFSHNTFENFSHAPIYFAPSHSVRSHPNESNTNPWTEEIIQASCHVAIDSNIFIGKEVQDPSYYCAALIIAKKCYFTNNYLKDIVNYSDKKAKGYTAYDTYLSCVEVDYENNYVENMMSYAKDGATKPHNEIGKSKTNPLEPFGTKAIRRYVNNIFISDGSKFRKLGADESSLTTSIFNNVSPIDTFVWANNAVIYKYIVLTGRPSSTKYGTFQLSGNYFECSEISGNMVFANSAYDLSEIDISNNTFKFENVSRPVVFNQSYNDEYHRHSHRLIRIVGNEFINSAPVYHFFVADTVRIRDNKSEKMPLNGNLYLNDYTGNPRALQARSMDVDINLDADNPQGGIIQFFSNDSRGTYSSSVTSIPKRGILFHYLAGGKHKYKIVFNINGEEREVCFENDGRNFYYEYNGKRAPIRFGETDIKIWYQRNGVVVSTSFMTGKNNDILTSLSLISGTKEGSYKLSYVSM